MDLSKLESLIFDKMALTRMPGLSLALVDDGEVVYARGFGQRDVLHGLPATPDTLYGIGSVTKSFTALAIMQLAQLGKLSLSDPVERHLALPLPPCDKPITIEHLLSHSSGIPALAYSEALIRHAHGLGGRALPIAGPSDVLTFMQGCDAWVEAEPGRRWMYSNEGYALLGLLIERLSGRPYENYVADEILRPLGMERSVFAKEQLEQDADRAVPYLVPSDGPLQEGRYLFRSIRSEGGLISSVLELARYMSVFLGAGAGVVSSESAADMMRPRVAMPSLTAPELFGEQEPARPQAHYALGLHVEQDFFGDRLVGHGGSVLVTTAHLAMMPDRRLGVAVLANASGYALKHVAQLALALYLGEDPQQLPFHRVDQALEPLVGRYETFKGTMQAEVVRQGDTLVYQVKDRAHSDKVVLVPESFKNEERRFAVWSAGGRLPVVFRHTTGGVELIMERYKLRRVGPL